MVAVVAAATWPAYPQPAADNPVSSRWPQEDSPAAPSTSGAAPAAPGAATPLGTPAAGSAEVPLSASPVETAKPPAAKPQRHRAKTRDANTQAAARRHARRTAIKTKKHPLVLAPPRHGARPPARTSTSAAPAPAAGNTATYPD